MKKIVKKITSEEIQLNEVKANSFVGILLKAGTKGIVTEITGLKMEKFFTLFFFPQSGKYSPYTAEIAEMKCETFSDLLEELISSDIINSLYYFETREELLQWFIKP